MTMTMTMTMELASNTIISKLVQNRVILIWVLGHSGIEESK